MQLIPASKELAPGSDENTRAYSDMSPADLKACHVQSRTSAPCGPVRLCPALDFLLDREQLRNSGREFQPKPEDFLHPVIEVFRCPLETLDRSREMTEVIHESVAADNVRHELPAPLGALLVKMPQGVAHGIIEKPRVQIAAYDEVAARSYAPQVSEERVQVVSLRQFDLDESEHNFVLRGFVSMDDVGLPGIPDAKTLTEEIPVDLVLEASLTAIREAGVLCWQQSSIKERVEHELHGVAYELVHDAQERDVAHLSRHTIGAGSYENRVNVLRILACDDLREYLVKCQGARGDRFIPGSTFTCQLLDLDIGSRDPGVLLNEREDVAASPLVTETRFDGLLAYMNRELLAAFGVHGSRPPLGLYLCKVGFGYGRPLKQSPPCYYLPHTEPTAQRPRVAIPGSGFTDFCLRTDMQTHVIGQGPTC